VAVSVVVWVWRRPAQLVTAPDGFGPRYFLLPFIAFGWTLLMLVRSSPVQPLRLAAVALLCVLC
jgi:hypothetical protein